MDAVVEVAFLESDARQRGNALLGVANLRNGEFQVTVAAHGTRPARIDDIVRPENGCHIARTERRKLVEDAHKLGGDVGKIDFQVHLKFGHKVLIHKVFADVCLKAAAEFRQVFRLHRQAGSVFVAAKVFQQVGAMVDGIVDVETLDGTRRASDQRKPQCSWHREVQRRHQSYRGLLP